MNGILLEPLDDLDPVDLNAEWWSWREIVRCKVQPNFWDTWMEAER